MKNLRPFVGVGVLLFSAQGKLLLCERKGSHGSGSWGPPGGHQEFGQTPEQTACNELREEVGIYIDPAELVFVGFTSDVFELEAKQYLSLFFAAMLPNAGIPVNCEPEKITQIGWYSPDQLPKNLFLPMRNFIAKYNLCAVVNSFSGHIQKKCE